MTGEIEDILEFAKLDVSRLRRMRTCLLLAFEPLPAHLIAVRGPARQDEGISLYLTLQIERRRVRVRPFRPQLRRERTQRLERALARGADRRHDAHAEILRRVGLRGEHGGIVVDPGIHEQRAALARAVGVAEAVHAARLDVDAGDLGAVVRRKDRELYGASPRVRREDGADVVVARTSVHGFGFALRVGWVPSAVLESKKKSKWAGLGRYEGHVAMCSHPRMASVHVSGSLRIASATTMRDREGTVRIAGGDAATYSAGSQAPSAYSARRSARPRRTYRSCHLARSAIKAPSTHTPSV